MPIAPAGVIEKAAADLGLAEKRSAVDYRDYNLQVPRRSYFSLSLWDLNHLAVIPTTGTVDSVDRGEAHDWSVLLPFTVADEQICCDPYQCNHCQQVCECGTR